MGKILKVGSTWFREGEEGFVFLEFRIERQALPRGSSPLMAFGGKAICGQYWTVDEVEDFIATLGWQKERICVFEYTRTEKLPAYYQQIYEGTA